MKKKTSKKSKLSTKKSSVTSLGESFSIRPNYFARFRFDLTGLLTFLKSASGQKWSEVPLAYQCLDDLGHWTFVRASEVFEYTAELEEQLKNQFHLLQSIFTYELGDQIYWAPTCTPGSVRQRAMVVEKFEMDHEEFFRIQIENTEATVLVSLDALNFWNGAGSSMPIDELRESIDWDHDRFFLKHLANFKESMAKDDFSFDFSLSGKELLEAQTKLWEKLTTFFKISQGDLRQAGRGVGFLACGQGNSDDQALIEAFVFQALGQSFGIKARLWQLPDQKLNLHVSLGKQSQNLLGEGNFILDEPEAFPLQRPLAEVLRRVIAFGPFGRWESPNWIKPSFDAISQEFQIHSESSVPDSKK